MTLTAHLLLVSKLRKHGATPPIPHTLSWSGASLIKQRVNYILILPLPVLKGITVVLLPFIHGTTKHSNKILSKAEKHTVLNLETHVFDLIKHHAAKFTVQRSMSHGTYTVATG
jgi:hypothetical protein